MLAKSLNKFFRKTSLALACVLLLGTAGAARGADSGAKMDPAEWKKVVEAAKKEGKLVISGDPGEEWRAILVDAFRQEYPEIKVEYGGMAGRNYWLRVLQERKLGQKLWDMRAGGVEAMAFEAKNNGHLEAIRPLLLPENADDSKWVGGLDGLFHDKEHKYMPAYTIYVQHTAFVNRDFIKEAEIKGSWQLLDPKFKGKMVLQTPTGGATFSSLGNMAFMYGENFVRDLLTKQDVVVTDDNRQQTEWLVRGKYPIVIGLNNTLLIPFQRQGLGKNIAGLEDKVIQVATSLGGISYMKDAPHPNASRVYINWLLSQKTQAKLTANVRLNSRRTDVPPVDKATAVDAARLEKYRLYSTEENVALASRFLPVVREILKK